MGYRRKVSTNLSTDERLRGISDAAALFYTWLIPHVDGVLSITSDSDELAAIVVPNRKRWTPQRVSAVVLELLGAGLARYTEAAGGLLLDLSPNHERRNQVGQLAKWRRAVMRQDEWACVECGATSDLHVHHILSWADHPTCRFDVNNGVTLCATCHRGVHYGT